MSYIRKATVNISASTVNASQYTTDINGFCRQIKFTPGSYSTKHVLTLGRESSADVIAKIPVTTATTKYNVSYQMHASTGNLISSSAAPRTQFPLADERIKINIPAASSVNATTAKLEIYYE